ncbi:hypothetical protein Q31b_35430 [Novipirellula aureliae]|uniref:Outer membrane efflux protein n=1 Tax=Novipirellula aureliae TaxID=2527966 RepID=A0A5C6DTZ2_9BACT|nr:hypothetical protein [Novipirellula aureliae]TWU40198.1 hypothetical protein Q31b_35430 [Novipirellula aureliae]
MQTFQTTIGRRSGWPWLSTLLLSALAISSAKADPNEIDAESWRNQKLKEIATKIQDAQSSEDRLEYVARRSWLQQWEPGQMLSAPTQAPAEPALVEEPSLGELEGPPGIEPQVWQRMISSQTELLAIDTDDSRKENLRRIIASASQLEEWLSNKLPVESQQLPAPTAWVLAFTRYRLGRALAYRELPSVRERWPISEPVQYQKRLLEAYQRLLDQTKGVRPEFILLEDRILRRSSKRGRALELLESHQGVIQAKWYLKKRRDLLEELGWQPPYQEAARIYFEAGYRDDP